MVQAERWNYHGTNHFRKERAAFLQSRADRENVERLHLGCGERIFRGYLNIDHRGGDLIGDITQLDFPENSVSEIMAIHVFEHLYPHKADEILKGWLKILKPGGKLIMEMPDLLKVLEHFKNPQANLNLTLRALYGGALTSERMSDDPADWHKWCYTFSTIKPVLEHCGYKNVVEKPAAYHIPIRDFRVECQK